MKEAIKPVFGSYLKRLSNMKETKFKDTEICRIPEDWEIGKFEDVLCTFSAGATPYRGIADNFNGNIRWISSGELNYNTIFDTVEHISEKAVKNTHLTIHQPGTFLMAITGLEAAGTRGKCAFVGMPSTTNQSCLAINATDKMCTEYLFYFYRMFSDYLAFKYCQGTKQQSYTASIVRGLPIIYPKNVSEQSRIAAALTSIANLISSLDKLIEKKKNIKQGAMQQLLSGKIRLGEFAHREHKFKDTEIGKIPEDWEINNLGNTFEFISNNTFSRDDLSYEGRVKNIHYGDVLISYGSYVDVNRDYIPAISNSDYYAKRYVQDGDVIIADTAEDTTVGKAVEVINVGDSLVVSGLHTMWLHPKNNEIFQIGYLGYAFNSSLFHNQLLPLMQGTKVTSVSKTAIKSTYIVTPPKLEQHYIVSVLTSIDNEIASLEAKKAKYERIKQGMMQQLLTGKIRLIG